MGHGYRFSRQPVHVPRVSTKHREIKTAIPSPGTEEILCELEKYESRSMQGQMPIVWNAADNFNIYDKHGNKWIDFTSTIFVANVGHANPHVLAAIRTACDRPLLHSYAYAHEIRASYLKKLVEFTQGQFEKAFLLSAGTEATEAALKLMRMHGQLQGKRRPGVICIEGNWHGRTMGAQMMSSNLAQKEWVGYQDPNIHYIPFPYPWISEAQNGPAFLEKGLHELERSGISLQKDVCGFMLETFQGWGAVFYPKNFVESIAQACKKNNILLTFDEMQSGFARTGKRFGYEHYGVKPDLICCGKGMGGGVPVSGVLGSAAIMDLPEVGNMSSTHSANPLVCAAGQATLEEIERLGLVSESARKGVILHARLNELVRKFPTRITTTLGKGLLAGVIFKEAVFASRLSERCMQKGLLVVHTGRESINLAPPLTIDDDALLEGIAVMDEAIGELEMEKM